jgi:hypothetical protein
MKLAAVFLLGSAGGFAAAAWIMFSADTPQRWAGACWQLFTAPNLLPDPVYHKPIERNT